MTRLSDIHAHRQNRRGVATTRFDESGVETVKRDRRVAVRSVACPTCGAAAGEPCSSASAHRPRRVMGLRAERGQS